MKRFVPSHAFHFLAAAGLLAGLAAPASLRADDSEMPQTILYNGQSAASAGIRLGGLGTGTAQETTEQKLSGDWTLKITVRDFYQGARLDFQKPADLGPILRNPNAYLTLSAKMSGASQQVGGGMPGMGMPGVEMAGPGAPGPGAPGMMMPGATTVTVPKISKLRLVFVGQKRSFEVFTEGELRPDANGWVTVGVPLDSLKAQLGDAPFLLERVVIAADSADTLYIGRIALVNDGTPITLKASCAPAEKTNLITPVSFSANVAAGVSALKVTWDFDSSDGIQEEAVGARVQHAFPKPGHYVITSTARPSDGAKKEPATDTIEIDVVP